MILNKTQEHTCWKKDIGKVQVSDQCLCLWLYLYLKAEAVDKSHWGAHSHIVSHRWGSALDLPRSGWTWSLVPLLGQGWWSRSHQQPIAPRYSITSVRTLWLNRLTSHSKCLLYPRGEKHRLCILLAATGQEAGSIFLPTSFTLPQHLTGFGIREINCIISLLHLTPLFLKVHKHKRLLKLFQLSLASVPISSCVSL